MFSRGFRKTAAACEVCMSKKDFVREHKHLLKVLKSGSRKAELAEAKSQAKELKEKL